MLDTLHNQQNFPKNGEEAHNLFREIHAAPKIKLNDKMTKEAEEYAKKLVELNKLEHSKPEDRDNQGENLAMKCSEKEGEEVMTAQEATRNW